MLPDTVSVTFVHDNMSCNWWKAAPKSFKLNKHEPEMTLEPDKDKQTREAGILNNSSLYHCTIPHICNEVHDNKNELGHKHGYLPLFQL